MAEELDEAVEAYRSRPLPVGAYTYVWMDALTHKVREGGRIGNVACAVATRNAQGQPGDLGHRAVHYQEPSRLDGVPATARWPKSSRRALGDLRQYRAAVIRLVGMVLCERTTSGGGRSSLNERGAGATASS
jgi:hypothetical protein